MPKYQYVATPTSPPPPIYFTSPRKQYLKSKGWIPPKSIGYNEVIEPPPSPPLTYNPHPITHQETMARRAYTFKNHTLTLFMVRTGQSILAVVYFVLLAYSASHHGWWMMSNLGMPLGFGFSAALLTLLAALPTFLGYDSQEALTSGPKFILHFTRTVMEWILIGFWCAAFITMLLNKGKDFKLLFDKPPYAEWIVAAVIAAIEIALFLWSSVLILQEKYIRNASDPFTATVQLSGLSRRSPPVGRASE